MIAEAALATRSATGARSGRPGAQRRSPSSPAQVHRAGARLWWAAFLAVLAGVSLMPVDRSAFVALVAAGGLLLGALRPLVCRSASRGVPHGALALLVAATLAVPAAAAMLSRLPSPPPSPSPAVVTAAVPATAALARSLP